MYSSSQYGLRWNNHHNNLLAAFDQLLDVEYFTDVILACEEGVTLHAHRLVLAACSSYFQTLFINTHIGHHPIVVLKDVQARDMRALLEFMYRGKVIIEHDHLQRFLMVAESFKIKGLAEGLRPQTPPYEATHPPTAPVDTSLDRDNHRELRNICELDLRESRDICNHLRDPQKSHSLVPHLTLPCPDSLPHKHKRRPMKAEPSPTSILRTELEHPHGFPGHDMSSRVSLASSMIPQPGLLSSHVPHHLPNDHRDHIEPQNELHDDESRSYSDISREAKQDKIKLESLANGPRQPTSRNALKRYKQYTKADLMDAIEAVKNGMPPLLACTCHKVPSRTLYYQMKKMGIKTLRHRLPSKELSSYGEASAPHIPHEASHMPMAMNL